MIKKVYSDSQNPRKNLKYDQRKKQYFSWGFDIRRADGTRARESGFDTEEKAMQAVAEIRKAEQENKFNLPRSVKRAAPTFAQLVEKYTATLERRHTKTTAKRVLDLFLKMLPAGIAVSDVTTDLMWDFINDRLANGNVKASTVRREMNSIAACLHSAPQFFSELQKWQAPKIPRPKAAPSRRERVISDAEIRHVLTWLTRSREQDERQKDLTYRLRIAQIFEFALLTAMREGEICKLEWRDVDTEAGRITIRAEITKTGKTRYFSPLTDRVREILKARKELNKDSSFVFTRSGALPTDFHDILRSACRAGNILYGKDTPGGLVFHDARHTATTRMIQAGIDISTVQSITGHSDSTMVLYYSHPSKDSREKAVKVLENLTVGTNNGRMEKGAAAK